METEINRVGIIGLGRFGEFIPTIAPKSLEIVGYDVHGNTADGVTDVSFEDVVNVDALILAVPLDSYRTLLPKIAKLVLPSTLIIDICSVKVLPEQLFEEYFGTHPNILITHPLFGPQSAKDSTKGHQLIVSNQRGARAEQVIDYCKEALELKVATMSSEEHDKIMGQIHVLTFFVARGLASMNLVDTPFETPSYQMIRDLVAFNGSHSDELFNTIQLGNPYGETVREELIAALDEVNSQLKQAALGDKNND